jgi:hypothetical protein
MFLAVASGVPFANPQAPTVTEMLAIKNVTPAVRINGYSFNVKASAATADRSFTDDPAVEARGFNDFGGSVPFYLPTNFSDTSDILQQTFTLIKTPGVLLYAVVGLQALSTALPIAGDWISVYQVLTDGSQADTSGNIGSITSITFLPQGIVYPLAIVAPAAPVALVMTIPTTGTVGKVIWPVVTYQGINVTQECTYVSSDTTKLVPNGDGAVLYCLAAGTGLTVTASFPGATPVVSAAITLA